MQSVELSAMHGDATSCVERLNRAGFSAQLVELRKSRDDRWGRPGSVVGYGVSVLVGIRDPLIYWYTKQLLPSFIGNDQRPCSDFDLKLISPGIVLSPAPGDTLAVFEEKLMQLQRRVQDSDAAAKIKQTDSVHVVKARARSVEVGMTVTGKYYGVPFEGVVREVDDDFPETMHGQPAGRNCYIDLTAPIVLDRGKSYERMRSSVSAFACELTIVGMKEGQHVLPVS